MAEIAILASPRSLGRGSATVDERRAAAHLAHQLERAGVEALGDPPLRMQSFSFGAMTSQNVLGIIRPSGDSAASTAPAIVLGAHYDHLGVSNGEVYLGADDNASGTAAVLGVARSLVTRRSELARPVVIVFFGAEEIGMRGSRAFVDGGPIPKDRMFAMVNVDMIGRPLTDQAVLLPLLGLAGIDPDASVGVDGLRGRPGFDLVVRDACRAEDHRAITIEDFPKPLQPTASNGPCIIEAEEAVRRRATPAPAHSKKSSRAAVTTPGCSRWRKCPAPRTRFIAYPAVYQRSAPSAHSTPTHPSFSPCR